MGNIANDIDEHTKANVVISEPHSMNHEGFMFHTSGKITGVLDAGVHNFLLVTAALNFPHIQRARFDFGGGDVDIEMYEGATASSDGTPLTANNTNRNSSLTADMVPNSAPTLTDDGTLIHSAWAYPTSTGTGRSPTGVSDVTNGEEWILKPSEKYLIRVTNNSGGTISFRYEFLWYEIGY